MTKDDVIRAADTAGITAVMPFCTDDEQKCLVHFAELVMAIEREVCASLVHHLKQSVCEASIEAYAMKDALGQAEDVIRTIERSIK